MVFDSVVDAFAHAIVDFYVVAVMLLRLCFLWFLYMLSSLSLMLLLTLSCSSFCSNRVAIARPGGAMNPYLAVLLLALANPGLGGGVPPGLFILPAIGIVASVLVLYLLILDIGRTGSRSL